MFFHFQFDENVGDLDSDQLSNKLNAASARRDFNDDDDDEDEGEDDEDKFLTDEAKEKKKKFKDRRKNHYNEFMNIKKARELINSELAEDDDDEDEEGQMDVSK